MLIVWLALLLANRTHRARTIIKTGGRWRTPNGGIAPRTPWALVLRSRVRLTTGSISPFLQVSADRQGPVKKKLAFLPHLVPPETSATITVARRRVVCRRELLRSNRGRPLTKNSKAGCGGQGRHQPPQSPLVLLRQPQESLPAFTHAASPLSVLEAFLPWAIGPLEAHRPRAGGETARVGLLHYFELLLEVSEDESQSSTLPQLGSPVGGLLLQASCSRLLRTKFRSDGGNQVQPGSAKRVRRRGMMC